MSYPFTIQQGVPSCHSLLLLFSLIFSSSLQIYHFISQVSSSVPITSLTLESRQSTILLLPVYSPSIYTLLSCLSPSAHSFPFSLQHLTLSHTPISSLLCCPLRHNISPTFVIQGDLQPSVLSILKAARSHFVFFQVRHGVFVRDVTED